MSRSHHFSKCGRSCWVCNADKLKGHGGDWMRPGDRRRAQDDKPSVEEINPSLRRYDEWSAKEPVEK